MAKKYARHGYETARRALFSARHGTDFVLPANIMYGMDRLLSALNEEKDGDRPILRDRSGVQRRIL